MGNPTSSLNVESGNCSSFTATTMYSVHAATLYSQINVSSIPIHSTLHCKGYKCAKEISKALQGSVYEATKNEVSYIIKTCNKSLYNQHIMYYNNKRIPIEEDIVKEAHILKYLSNNNPPVSLTQFIDFFENSNHYFLVMQNAGNNLFYFVKECHEYIQCGVLTIDIWRTVCKQMMRQIVSLMDWMHNTMHCCHLDISLENFAINNIRVMLDETEQNILSFGDDFQIKIIDFGLARVFQKTNKNGQIDFRCDKYAGKIEYKSPKIYNKQIFDARSADCWSLGICLFKMIIGNAPYAIPSVSDRTFYLIINGLLISILYSWNKMDYVTPNILDLMNRLFVQEDDRLNIKDIENHNYFLK